MVSDSNNNDGFIYGVVVQLADGFSMFEFDSAEFRDEFFTDVCRDEKTYKCSVEDDGAIMIDCGDGTKHHCKHHCPARMVAKAGILNRTQVSRKAKPST